MVHHNAFTRFVGVHVAGVATPSRSSSRMVDVVTNGVYVHLYSFINLFPFLNLRRSFRPFYCRISFVNSNNCPIFLLRAYQSHITSFPIHHREIASFIHRILVFVVLVVCVAADYEKCSSPSLFSSIFLCTNVTRRGSFGSII